jgi:hypothetical protein
LLADLRTLVRSSLASRFFWRDSFSTRNRR